MLSSLLSLFIALSLAPILVQSSPSSRKTDDSVRSPHLEQAVASHIHSSLHDGDPSSPTSSRSLADQTSDSTITSNGSSRDLTQWPGYHSTGFGKDRTIDQDSSGWTMADEWVIRLNPVLKEVYYFGYEHVRTLEQDQLTQIADSIASDFDLENRGLIQPFHGTYIFKHKQSSALLPHHNMETRDLDRLQRRLAEVDKGLEEHPSILWSSRQHYLTRQKRTNFNDPMFARQWHLLNRKEHGHDINVTEVWHNNITGEGVVIAVVDDGLEHANADIQLNYNAAGSYDFNDDDNDPTPNLKSKGDNTHGTKCAGLISAVANNNLCAVGVAHGASVSGIRMLDGKVTDALEAQSFIYKAHVNWIYSCSWGPEDSGKAVEGPGNLAREALEMGTSSGRYGYGNIYVFASGNGGQMHDNCNFDGYANSIYTLTVGAVDEQNKMPYYAELCPSMLAVTYSNGHASGDRNIVTTDASTHGGCTKSFSGTSAAAPIAAGMVALMLQVRRCLTWRDVQSVLIYSAVKVDVKGAQWVENGAGFHHSDQHGFGLMDAYRMTVVAGVWPLLPDMIKWTVPSSTHGGQDNKIPPTGSSLLVTSTVVGDEKSMELNTLEYVAVTLSLSHVRRGALQITLISPNETCSILSTPRTYDIEPTGFDGWTFTTSKFWGETPAGVWILNITDTNKFPSVKRKGGVLKSWSLTLYGSELTSEDIKTRKRLVEEAISQESLHMPLSCPPLPASPKDLKLPLNIRKLKLWEKIVVVVLAVIGGVLILHLIFEFVSSKYKQWKRKRQLLNSSSNNIRLVNILRKSSERRGRSSGGEEEEEEEAKETSRLILLETRDMDGVEDRERLYQDRESFLQKEERVCEEREGGEMISIVVASPPNCKGSEQDRIKESSVSQDHSKELVIFTVDDHHGDGKTHASEDGAEIEQSSNKELQRLLAENT